MTTASKLRVGDRVNVLWGHDEPRAATVLEVWGSPVPTHVRVELDPVDQDSESTVLLLSPASLQAV